jgi:adenine C2-methylase RlmN of 23S rRNA A2503 and tRNA A37
VSTVGIIDKIRRLTRELPEISLAVSLHAPNQEMRSAVVPSAKYFPIEQLIEALDDHMMAFLQKSKRAAAASDNPQNGDSTIEQYTEEERIKESTRRRAMVEYVMLEGESSSTEAAHQLGKLCEGRQLVVNLIPYNQTDVKDKLRCPSIERLHEFRNIVASYGTFCTIRRTMGADIDSACGQLITLEGNTAEGIRDIEDVASSPLTAKQKGASPRPRRVETTISAQLRLSTNLLSANLDEWILPLTVATSMAAACFVATTSLYLRQRRS